jgi:hypothetical protein
MTPDGDLVVSQGSSTLWHAGTAGNPGAFLVVQDDGNLVLYKWILSAFPWGGFYGLLSLPTPVWQTGTAGKVPYPTVTIAGLQANGVSVPCGYTVPVGAKVCAYFNSSQAGTATVTVSDAEGDSMLLWKGPVTASTSLVAYYACATAAGAGTATFTVTVTNANGTATATCSYVVQ